MFDQLEQVVAEKLTRLRRQLAWPVGASHDGHAMRFGYFSGFGQLAVASGHGGKINDHRTGLHALHHRFCDQRGCFFTRNRGSGDDDVHLLGLLCEQGHFRLDELRAHLFGIATGTGAIFGKVEFQKLGSHTVDLVLDRWARVEGSHNRAEVLRSANRRKSGNTGTDDQHLCWRDFACGGDLSDEETPEVMRTFDDGAVSGDVRHRTENVHRLGACDARHGLQRECRDFLTGEFFQKVGVLSGSEQGGEDLAIAEQACFMLAKFGVSQRFSDLDDPVAAFPNFAGVSDQFRSGCAV